MLFIVEPIVVRVICQCGMPVNEEVDPNAEPDDEHVETATEGEYGLGPLVGFANVFILSLVSVASIGGIWLIASWIVRHGRQVLCLN